jgi:hypothetical protein
MTHFANSNAATHELSIEELDSVAGGSLKNLTVKGVVDSMLAGAVAGAFVGMAAGGVGAGPGAAGGAAAGGIGYLVMTALS